MKFYSIINIEKEEYLANNGIYSEIIANYKSYQSTNLRLELSLSSYGFTEELIKFLGIENLSIGSVYKAEHLDILLDLKKKNIIKKNSEIFCPILTAEMSQAIKANEFKDLDFILPIYNYEDLDLLYRLNPMKVKIFPSIVNDYKSLLKSLSAPIKEFTNLKINSSEQGYLPYSIVELYEYQIQLQNLKDDKSLAPYELKLNERSKINFTKLIGKNIKVLLERILDYNPEIELYFAGFAGLELDEIYSFIKEINEYLIKERSSNLDIDRISIATRNHDFKSIQKFLTNLINH
ncbi:MAG: hypothetical protein MK033_11885 [Candidatus Caenarcaniphilales bacterium]|nr:hypothetical protein [Candidatus Caenarcaniphilales bacterium]